MIKNFLKNFSSKNQTVLKINANKKNLLDEVVKRGDFEKALNGLPNPDVVLKKQGKDINIYRELSFDPHVFACIQSRKSGVVSQKWKLERENCSDNDYDFILDIFNNLDIAGILNGILEAPLYGYQPVEVMWEKDGQHIIPVNLVAKPAEWFGFNEDGELCYKKKGSPKGIEVPPMKFLLPRFNPTYLNPFGDSVLSRVFWSVVFKKGGLKFWSIFTEKYGMPFIVAKYNKGIDQNEIDSLADMLENMVQDAIAVIPNDSSVDIKSDAFKASSVGVYQKLIDHSDASISKAILGQTLTTEAGDSGSYALGNVHSDVRQDIILADKRICENTLNQLIHWTLLINKGDVDCPKFNLYKEKGVDKDLAERDKIIAEIMEKDGRSFSDDYLVRTYNYQPEDIVKVEKPKPDKKEFASDDSKSINLPSADELDNLAESLDSPELQKQMEDILKPVLELFKETSDPNAVMDKLAEVYPQMDTKELQEMLAKVIFISDSWGMITNE
nr:hypothetical protein 3 [bacterium]